MLNGGAVAWEWNSRTGKDYREPDPWPRICSTTTELGSPAMPANPTPIEHHYESLRVAMRDLFTALGLAA